MTRTVSVFLLLIFSALHCQSADQIIRGKDHFSFSVEIQLPEVISDGNLWVPLPKSDPFQEVIEVTHPADLPITRHSDPKHQNHYLHIPLTPSEAGEKLSFRYVIKRTEKSPYKVIDKSGINKHLAPEKLVPASPVLKEIANEVTGKIDGEKRKAQALYEHTLSRMRYDKSGKGWGRGDALFACDSRTGNCTDFHSYFIGLARSVGIPARFAIGFTIPEDKDSGTIGGYHCWAEYFTEGRWIPVDISKADKHPELATYYASHHPANRLQLTTGRDLQLKPAPKTGTLNYFVYPHLEIEGKSVLPNTKFTFKRIK